MAGMIGTGMTATQIVEFVIFGLVALWAFYEWIWLALRAEVPGKPRAYWPALAGSWVVAVMAGVVFVEHSLIRHIGWVHWLHRGMEIGIILSLTTRYWWRKRL